MSIEIKLRLAIFKLARMKTIQGMNTKGWAITSRYKFQDYTQDGYFIVTAIREADNICGIGITLKKAIDKMYTRYREHCTEERERKERE